MGCSLDVAEEVCVDDEVLLLGGDSDSDGDAREKTNGYIQAFHAIGFVVRIPRPRILRFMFNVGVDIAAIFTAVSHGFNYISHGLRGHENHENLGFRLETSLQLGQGLRIILGFNYCVRKTIIIIKLYLEFPLLRTCCHFGEALLRAFLQLLVYNEKISAMEEFQLYCVTIKLPVYTGFLVESNVFSRLYLICTHTCHR